MVVWAIGFEALAIVLVVMPVLVVVATVAVSVKEAVPAAYSVGLLPDEVVGVLIDALADLSPGVAIGVVAGIGAGVLSFVTAKGPVITALAFALPEP